MSKKVLFLKILLIGFNIFSQEKDTIIILFNGHHPEMERIDFSEKVQPELLVF